jgi:trigger factor
MQANLETLGQLERRLNVALPLDQIETEVESRLKRLARTVKVHGFRPGKVPMKIVAQQYGHQVREEVMGDALQKGFSEAVQEQKLRVAGYPRFEAKPAASGASQFEFSATFEVYPEVVVGDLSDAKIERQTATIGDAEIDKTLTILRKQHATFQPVERPAASGDQVNIDYRGTLDGVAFAGGQAQGYALVLGQGSLLKEFEDAVTGMKAGESKTFELTFPQDYHGKEMAGKTVSFEVKLNQVSGSNLPEIDAAFARSLGVEDGDMAKMRAEIKANLEREVSKRVLGKVRDQAMQVLLDHTKLEVPKALLDMEINSLMEHARQDMQSRGMNLADIPLSPEMFSEQAARRVALGLILAEVVKTNKLSASPDQVRALVEEHAHSYEQPQEFIRWYYERPERLREVESLVLEDNVVAWVLERAKVENKPTAFDELMGNA